MNVQDYGEHPSKRPKLSQEPPVLPLSNRYPGYLCLLKRSYRVKTNDLDVYKSLSKLPSPNEVELLDVLQSSENIDIQLKIPILKLTSQIECHANASDDSNYLTACLRLPADVKTSRKIRETPLAKYLATLTYLESRLILNVYLLWHDSVNAREKIDTNPWELFQTYFLNQGQRVEVEPLHWDVKEFYDNVHVPEVSNMAMLRTDSVQCKLYPFQERATVWMLSREGVQPLPSGQIGAKAQDDLPLPLDFREMLNDGNTFCYASKALNIVSSSKAEVQSMYRDVKGGILAEAMGLGKTVEMIALMCSHTRDQSPLKHPISDLIETGATLIVTPPTILEQWKQEIREHAPSLRVLHYTGLKSHSKNKNETLGMLADQDVVLTTYSVIASEIHYVQEAPDRNLRDRPRRVPPKSPLTQILWWRCLLDEAQMVESGVSNAAIVARLIPRVNAWAVTGTPLKQSHRDLFGLLLFLRHQPWCQSQRLWDYLVIYHRHLLRKLIGSIALRHSKEQVREELRIPAQTRRLVTIPFTAIEESHYAQMHFDMQHEVGLDKSGAPLADEWDPNDPAVVEKMRTWLQRLRQTCLHPEVGGRNRRALGKRGGGPLRTVAQVLEVMIDQTETIVHTERRNYLMAKADRGRILEHARDSEIAQELFKEAYTEATAFVKGCRKELDLELQKAKVKEKHDGADESGVDAEGEEEPEASVTTARQRLRSALEVQHVCIFFIGNTYFQLKEREELKLSEVSSPVAEGTRNISDETLATDQVGSAPTATNDFDSLLREKIVALEKLEADSYEEAKKIRTELLMEVHQKARQRIKRIRSKRDGSSFAIIPKLEYSPDDFGGIESRKVFEKLYHYCKAMNDQAEQLKEVRAKMTEMLCQALIDEEEGIELTGEEYEDSTKHQDEMYVVMEMLRALFADRSDALSGQENLLLKNETKQFLKDAKEGKGAAPELMIKLLSEREIKRINPLQQGSLRGIVTELRSLVSSLEWQESVNGRSRAELVIVNQLLLHVQKLQTEQTRSLVGLEQEVNSFRDTMNARLDYYRVLQAISDMVAPIGNDEDVGRPADTARITRLKETEVSAENKLSNASSKRRYLLHLKNEQDSEGEAKICTICQFEFEIGTLTICGHQFCKECIQMWWSAHRNCPVCKRRLHLADFYDVTYKPVDATKEVGEEQVIEDIKEAESTQPDSIYKTISPATLQQIRAIDLRGSSYGSKVDTLVRHVLHLRRSDPGSKSIIFSQYRDFLDVLSRSLRDNSIIHSKFDDKDGIVDFKSNPANECFLLHAKAHAAGLNLVCASHVILCEPLINTAIELQAISRVHRIGQLRETCVWMYLIEGTVEEAIYDISVKRRLAHMDGKSRDVSRAVSRAVSPNRGEIAIDAANAKELQAADLNKMFMTGKTGGELVDKEDLWPCLFGNVTARGNVGPSRGLADLGVASNVDAIGAGSEIGRFLRAEAVDRRRNQ